jgi:hypothetical protein
MLIHEIQPVLIALVLCVSLNRHAADDLPAPAPEPGEKELRGEELDQAFKTLAEIFQQAPAIKAKMTTEVEDLAGKRVEEGELILDRPARAMRKYLKPSPKIWLLNGAQLEEYLPSQKKIQVKDFSGAPKLLKQIQAAMTGDLKALEPLFTIRIFRMEQSGSLRLVLDKKAGTSRRLYQRIQARMTRGGLFFNEIRYIPDEGDEVTERFSEIRAIPKPGDAEFSLPAGADIERSVEKISE